MSSQELKSSQLNKSQQEAVDTIYGPLMVIAGPGTGKTQLLSARAAQIVAKTDINPSNILCLTYTESGATEMRNRLIKLMGAAGGDVAVHTFHSFGTWIISQYPNYFINQKALRPLDDISKHQILESLLSNLPFRHKFAVRDESEHFIWQNALQDIIRAFKQSGYSIDELKQISIQNKKDAEKLNELIEEIFSDTLGIKNIEKYTDSIETFKQKNSGQSLMNIIISSIEEAVEASNRIGKTGPLGDWRSKHVINQDNKKTLKTYINTVLLDDSIKLFEKYQAQLEKRGRYDYEDMVNWATSLLNKESDALMDLGEQFQYIMVDEYQDTNGAQNALLNALLGANPLDTPNIMVVGDDDQAIMRFQGAEYSGMMKFVDNYSPKIIVLKDNYRSYQNILDLSRELITGTDERLEVILKDKNFHKKLTSTKSGKGAVEHLLYLTPTEQYAGITKYIESLIASGVKASDIAVIGKKHAPLNEFVAHLEKHKINYNYERQRSVLESRPVEDLLSLAKYIDLLANDEISASHLLPTILSSEYWELEPLDTYKIAALAKNNKKTWLDAMLSSQNSKWQGIAEFLIALSTKSKTSNFTNMLDYLIGRQPLPETVLQSSPYKKYLEIDNPDNYYSLLSHIITLRSKVLEVSPSANKLSDLIEVVDQYRSSKIDIHDKNPLLHGNLDGVQILTAHGSKGREFEHVIVLSAIDEMWGKKSRSQTIKIPLPENLQLYPAGDTDSDRIRLLYVAMTRAKQSLIFTSYKQNDTGKSTNTLSFIDQGDGHPLSPVESKTDNEVVLNDALDTTWSLKGDKINRDIKSILKPQVDDFRLSPSALQSFVDVRYGGPIAFIEKNLLKFPSAYNVYTALGTAAHSTIEFAYQAYSTSQTITKKDLIKHLDKELSLSGLTSIELSSARDHAHIFIPKFIEYFRMNDFKQIITTEKYLNAVIKQQIVPITGSIDAISEIDNKLNIIDYKTGKPPTNGWNTASLSDSKKIGLHFNRQQLYFYKILLEESSSYKQPVESAELIFVESAEAGSDNIVRLKISEFDKTEMERLRKLIKAVDNKIRSVDFPDISQYPKNLKGILEFEEDLISSI